MRSWRNWQTHQLEGLAVAIPWWFESTRPHQFFQSKISSWRLALPILHHDQNSAPCGTTTSFAADGKPGTSQRNRMVAAIPPANCATTNRGTSTGRIPANVSLKHLAIVTAGLAKDVEAVNQYAAVI